MGFQSGRSGGVGTGRIALNPQGCKRVTRQMVLKAAQKIGKELSRDGQGMWFYKKNGEWWNLGQTNYLAWKRLNNWWE